MLSVLPRPLRRAVRHSRLVLDQRVDGSSTIGVLKRLWAWQLWRRIARRGVTIRCAEGSLLRAPPWSRVAAVIAGAGLTERDDAIFVLDLLRGGDLFVDVGANIGFYSVLAAARGARVEAFEPTPDAADSCEQSARINGLQEHVSVHRLACGAAPGAVRFTTGLDISNHVVDRGEEGIEVRLSTLDLELAGLPEPSMAMFKIDAEGHDMEVLRGSLEVIKRLRPAVLVEIWTGGSGPLQVLEGLGYEAYSYDPETRILSQLAAGGRRGGGNSLLISEQRVEEIRGRLSSAARPALRAPSIHWRRPAAVYAPASG